MEEWVKIKKTRITWESVHNWKNWPNFEKYATVKKLRHTLACKNAQHLEKYDSFGK